MEKKNSKKPFFAAFLENQIKETKNVKGGSSTVSAATTPLGDGVTKPIYDTAQTMKYPSDGDEGVGV
ncbi:microviridin/marinostatin family tricyclic proteinase inhibitor [Chryseobacterium sp. GMJ5]|uniref:Microviridin/marinostatin family tricyclic proteinase inhibitor n=1 Tax=Chryseobacterium gilvum TaxID=2976534 RepID=A0ABT2VY21_9FLAO|nr:microviridin/marinostatin family tricyclic proteinase inhibitor [Chryseobacterium gilvum]MCU7614905.1 microviridin/marinostatin family tricyclic proteinase inhibitor [Chryseobacterium gilvum]